MLIKQNTQRIHKASTNSRTKEFKTVALRIILTEIVIFVNRIIHLGNLTRLTLNRYAAISTKQRMRERKRNI